ncbi:MAG: PilZ domain-containing protein [Planctomycetes bacterium]|nr:PilZ domain-containing protein [Planctomycetota bacterium]
MEDPFLPKSVSRIGARLDFSPPSAAQIELEKGGPAIPARVVNLSEGGLAFLLDSDLQLPRPTGTFGTIRFRLPEGPEVTCPVKLAHIRARGDHWYVGAVFVDISRETQRLISDRVRGVGGTTEEA